MMLAVGPVEAFSIGLSAVSIALALVAIWLSWLFYKAGNANEKSTAESLSGIKRYSEVLATITDKHLGRLTRAAIDSTAVDHMFAQLCEVMKSQHSQFVAVDAEELDEDDFQTVLPFALMAQQYAAYCNQAFALIRENSDTNDPEKIKEFDDMIDGSLNAFQQLENLRNEMSPGIAERCDVKEIWEWLNEVRGELTDSQSLRRKLTSNAGTAIVSNPQPTPTK